MSSPFTIGKLTRRRSDGSKYWSFCVMWWGPEGRVRKTLDTQDRPTAEAKARRLYENRDKERAGLVNTVGACVDAYLNSLGGTRDETRKRAGWKAAQPFWGNVPVEIVDAGLSRSYIEWRKRATNTVRNELSLVRTALNWKLGKDAPPVVLPGMPPSKVGHLTKDQFRTFLAGCAMPHVRLFAILAVTTGARKTALLEAKWDQVDWDRGLLALNAEGRVQTSKQRATVPLNALAMEALREAREGATCEHIIEYRCGPIADIQMGLRAASARSGVRAHAHMFRHSSAVWQAEARVPMAEISAFLGHRDINITTRIYARYSPDFLRNAADALTW